MEGKEGEKDNSGNRKKRNPERSEVSEVNAPSGISKRGGKFKGGGRGGGGAGNSAPGRNNRKYHNRTRRNRRRDDKRSGRSGNQPGINSGGRDGTVPKNTPREQGAMGGARKKRFRRNAKKLSQRERDRMHYRTMAGQRDRNMPGSQEMEITIDSGGGIGGGGSGGGGNNSSDPVKDRGSQTFNLPRRKSKKKKKKTKDGFTYVNKRSSGSSKKFDRKAEFDQLFDRKKGKVKGHHHHKNTPPRLVLTSGTLLKPSSGGGAHNTSSKKIPSPFQNISTVQTLIQSLEETAANELNTENRKSIFGEWVLMLKVNDGKKFFDDNFTQGKTFKDVFLKTSCLARIILSMLEYPDLDDCHEQVWELLSILFNSAGENDDNFDTFYLIENLKEIGKQLRSRDKEVSEVMHVHLMSIISLLVIKDEFLKGNLVWLEKQMVDTEKKLRELTKDHVVMNHSTLAERSKLSAHLVDLSKRKKNMLITMSQQSRAGSKEVKDHIVRQRRVFDQAVKKGETEKETVKLKEIKEKFSLLVDAEEMLIAKYKLNTDRLQEREEELVQKKIELERQLREIDMKLNGVELEKEKEIIKTEECTRRIVDLGHAEEKEIAKVQENTQIPAAIKRQYHEFTEKCKKIMENSYGKREKFFEANLENTEWTLLMCIQKYLNCQKSKILNYLEKRLSKFCVRILELKESFDATADQNGRKARRFSRLKKNYRKYAKAKGNIMSVYEASRSAIDYVTKKYTPKRKNEAQLHEQLKVICQNIQETMKMIKAEYYLKGEEWEKFFNENEKKFASPEPELSRSPSIDSIGSFMSDSDASEFPLDI